MNLLLFFFFASLLLPLQTVMPQSSKMQMHYLSTLSNICCGIRKIFASFLSNTNNVMREVSPNNCLLDRIFPFHPRSFQYPQFALWVEITLQIVSLISEYKLSQCTTKILEKILNWMDYSGEEWIGMFIRHVMHQQNVLWIFHYTVFSGSSKPILKERQWRGDGYLSLAA